MAAELITPTDEFSGIPLPLIPTDEMLPLNTGDVANWHHHYHPSTDPILTGTLGGKALRSSRIQLVAAEQHNFTQTAYHRFFAGPPLPEKTGDQFGTSVLLCAGYVPDYAIDVSNGEPQIKPMIEQQLERLRMQAEVVMPGDDEVERYRLRNLPDSATHQEANSILSRRRHRQAALSYRHLRYGYEPVRTFFGDIVTRQSVSHVAEPIREEFLVTGAEDVGLQLLAQAAIDATESTKCRGMLVSELYKEARDEGKLHPKMPPDAATLVYYKLGESDSRKVLLSTFRRRLLGDEKIVDYYPNL